MSLQQGQNRLTPATDVADGAVGVPGAKWFVAVVNNRCEKAVAGRLSKNGFDSFVATQTQVRIWKNGRRAKVDHVVIPALVFVRCTEPERRQIVGLPYINRFMVDKAAGDTSLGHKPPAVIPEAEMAKLKFMLGQTDVPVTIAERPYRRGDKVRVARGSLLGLVGEVGRDQDGKKEIIVRLDILGAAYMLIDSIDLELLP